MIFLADQVFEVCWNSCHPRGHHRRGRHVLRIFHSAIVTGRRPSNRPNLREPRRSAQGDSGPAQRRPFQVCKR